jgi:NTE family protein
MHRHRRCHAPPATAAPRSEGITLVLGGGGFKGVAHLGVLRVLQDEGVRIERIVGSSAGALIGASYCHLGDATATHALVMRFLQSEGLLGAGPPGFRGLPSFRRRTGRVPLVRRLVAGIRRQVALERMFRRSSAFGGSSLRFIVRSLVPKVDIGELPLPLAVCVLDLQRGEDRLLTRGPLTTAITASGAVPGFFPPVEWEDTLLCDAGIVNNLPTRRAREAGALHVVAVDLSAALGACRADAAGMEVLLRAQDISTRLANRRWASDADIVIAPELGGRHWLDTSDLEQVVQCGARAAREALPGIRGLLEAPARRAI